MPLLTEREHMQLWCPEARVVVIDAQPQEGPKIALPGAESAPIKFIEASPTLNRMDMNPGGLRVPLTALCFGSRCGAWQWSHWHKGRDGKHYITRGEAKTDAHPLVQLGYCGKAAPLSQDMVPPSKPTSLPAPEPANESAATEPEKPVEGAPKGETLQ